MGEEYTSFVIAINDLPLTKDDDSVSNRALFTNRTK